jgi:hypothetical protein
MFGYTCRAFSVFRNKFMEVEPQRDGCSVGPIQWDSKFRTELFLLSLMAWMGCRIPDFE